MRHSFKPLQLFWVFFNHCPATIPANFSLMKIKPVNTPFNPLHYFAACSEKTCGKAENSADPHSSPSYCFSIDEVKQHPEGPETHETFIQAPPIVLGLF